MSYSFAPLQYSPARAPAVILLQIMPPGDLHRKTRPSYPGGLPGDGDPFTFARRYDMPRAAAYEPLRAAG